MAFIPVNPELTSEKSIASLANRFEHDQIRPTKLGKENEIQIFNNFQIIQTNIDARIAAELKIGNIFGGEYTDNKQAIYFDAITYVDQPTNESIDGKSIIRTTRYGIGLRILLSITTKETNIFSNFATVAAAVQMGKATARYEIKGLGIGNKAFAEILKEISPLSNFSLETYGKINNKIIQNYANHILEKKDQLTPQILGVDISEPIGYDHVESARSVIFAIKCIEQKKSLNETIKAGGLKYDRKIMENTYEKLVGEILPSDQPSKDAIKRARDWLR